MENLSTKPAAPPPSPRKHASALWVSQRRPFPKLLSKSKPPLQQDSCSYQEAGGHPWGGGGGGRLAPPRALQLDPAATPGSDVLENSPLPRPPGEGVHSMKWG